MKRYTEEQVRKLVRDFMGKATQKDMAAVMQISPQYLSDFLRGRRPGQAILKAVGLKREVRYVRDEC